jgi:NAD(P)-dependent dehydrogenase (short-subunit alcohol dehydrogenase family)
MRDKGGAGAARQIYADEVAITKVKVNLVDPGRLRTAMRAQAYPGEKPEIHPARDGDRHLRARRGGLPAPWRADRAQKMDAQKIEPGLRPH